MPIDQTELDDFRAVLADEGIDPDEFGATLIENPPTPGEISPVRGKITVTNLRNNIARSYPSGHATAWVVGFRKDLKAGLFKLP